MQKVEVQQLIAAPIETVWARYTDHASWTEWAGLGRVRLEREGVPAPNGVGCVRVISSAGVNVAEEVLSFEPPHRMTYRVIRGGLPMRDHLGEVCFEPRDGATLITWRCQFESRLPGLGGIFRRVITRLFRNALQGLSRQLA
ncbi:MAG: SRPBCC family protein [Candidatus Binatia bacterium]